MVYFHTNIHLWVYFGGPWNGKCWYILVQFGIQALRSFVIIFYEHWVLLLYFGILFHCFGIMYQEKSGNPEAYFVEQSKSY
jgi:hypothetical protein